MATVQSTRTHEAGDTHTLLADDQTVVQRILDHIDHGTTDVSDASWREPVEHYRSEERLAAELELFRRHPTPFCPSVALPEAGSYIARDGAGTPLVVVRGSDGQVRAFRNACRHRGTQLADGSGCAKAFVCRYHGWTYGLDGRLRHVPHADGFPGLDTEHRGLVPVETTERHGLVFVTQEAPQLTEPSLDEIRGLITPDLQLIRSNENELPVNWKILVEGFLEGYHIRTTHPGTFYPVQYDNLNLVETFGRNNRLTFPYRSIEKLRALPPAERRVKRALTYVYHLFPAVMVATFPDNITIVVHEPLACDRTRVLSFTLTEARERQDDGRAAPARANDFVLAGAVEDVAMACAIQRGLASRANAYFEFGRFEGAIAHFHRSLDAALAGGR
jgi:phenylpropionate dioxygenase-like ring-hydroxylating dioxygenase large terminal subunit